MSFSFLPPLLITGLAQGPDPAGGVAVARAVRAAWPQARLVGQDYSVRAAGLHDPVFDDVVIHRPWGEFDTDALRTQIGDALDAGSLVISTIDLEGFWLATHFAGHPGVLSPPAPVYEAVCKPVRHAPALAGLAIPDSAPLAPGATAAHAFLRRAGWRAWLKGPFHDALRVTDWETFARLVRRLSRHWPFGGAHLQAHIEGTQEALGFAALNGRLLSAAWLVKNDVSEAGKTIAGTLRSIDPADHAALAAYVAALEWTGGGEIELIRDRGGTPWLMEINPRFPAWTHGAALLGINLPAALVEAVTGHAPTVHAPPPATGFVRVQAEVPTRARYDLLPPMIFGIDEPRDGAKTAFNIHEIAHHLRSTVGLPIRPADADSDHSGPDLAGLRPSDDRPTPRVHLLTDHLHARLAALNARVAATAAQKPAVRFAYSVKTNPDPRILAAVRAAGWGAEVIGIEELHHALAQGFPPDRILVNGPAKVPTLPDIAARCAGPIFADSLEEAEALAGLLPPDRPLGLRLRPAGIESRFGIALDSPGAVRRLHALAAGLPERGTLALHMHVPHAMIGRRLWRALAETLMDEARTVEDASGRPVVLLDLGGGWYPDDLMADLDWVCGPFLRRAVADLSRLHTVVLEPGRALVQDAVAVETRVLSVRTDDFGNQAVVVDAGLPLLSEADHFPHRVCRWTGTHWRPLPVMVGPGGDGAPRGRILGRTCMEADVLARDLPADTWTVGEPVLILDAGAYDRSMAYDFGRGGSLQA